MSGNVSAEETRAQHVAKMGTGLGEIYHGLSSQLAWAHFCWNDYRVLYGNPATIDLLNAAAPTFFWSLERMMLESVLLYLCRLTDRSEVARKRSPHAPAVAVSDLRRSPPARGATFGG